MTERTRSGAVAYVWRYEVKPERIAEFREAYGPEGVWQRYFAQSEAYLGTDLYEDRHAPGRFITVDYFADPHARPALVARHQAEFEKIDKAWEEATREEVFVGEFTTRTAE